MGLDLNIKDIDKDTNENLLQLLKGDGHTKMLNNLNEYLLFTK